MTGYVQLGDDGPSSPNRATSSSAPPLSYNSSAFINPSISGANVRGGETGERINKYETRLPVRLDIEAAGAYALGAVSGVILLVLETKNDYVRFHAWQSALIFIALGAIQFLISFLSSFLAWVVFICQLGAVGWFGYQAYINADTLERYEAPYVGQIASSWVDSE